MRLDRDFSEFIGFLSAHEVRFLVFGGYAVALHGHPRYTADLDVWVLVHPDNAERLLRALDDFGFGSVGLTAADSCSLIGSYSWAIRHCGSISSHLSMVSRSMIATLTARNSLWFGTPRHGRYPIRIRRWSRSAGWSPRGSHFCAAIWQQLFWDGGCGDGPGGQHRRVAGSSIRRNHPVADVS